MLLKRRGNASWHRCSLRSQREYRSLWERYYKDAQSIVFVVDSSDKMRMVVAKDELDALLAHDSISSRPIPILIYANKMDKAEALSAVEIMSLLGLQHIGDRAWQIQ